VRLALRNPGMPLDALRRSITPIGMHYFLVPFDLPEVDTAAYELVVDGRVHSLALTLDEAGGRIWRRVRAATPPPADSHPRPQQAAHRSAAQSPPTAVRCVSRRRSPFLVLSGLEGSYAVPLTPGHLQ
jgi:hypothetical protein